MTRTPWFSSSNSKSILKQYAKILIFLIQAPWCINWLYFFYWLLLVVLLLQECYFTLGIRTRLLTSTPKYQVSLLIRQYCILKPREGSSFTPGRTTPGDVPAYPYQYCNGLQQGPRIALTASLLFLDTYQRLSQYTSFYWLRLKGGGNGRNAFKEFYTKPVPPILTFPWAFIYFSFVHYNEYLSKSTTHLISCKKTQVPLNSTKEPKMKCDFYWKHSTDKYQRLTRSWKKNIEDNG